MARYIRRTCPKCRDDFWIAVRQPTPDATELPISAWCPMCGYQLRGWRLVLGRRKQAPEIRYGRMRKVFR
jgi:hypothetical protein